MSVVFETRNFIHDGGYPPMDDHQDHTSDVDRFTDPTDSVVNDLAPVATYNGPTTPFVTAETPRLELTAAAVSAAGKEDSPSATATPIRSKTIQKPEREITKNSEGKFVCTYPDCNDDMKEWTRKCEWNKHMDKHDRPYKCLAPGCEKLAGFTYSGGLLRHEREVHGKHGGPKNSLNCPHPHCKRYSGKGFSRAENLAEHLRRVHTGQAGAGSAADGDTDDAVSVASTGQKRKRGADDNSDALREEIKRLRAENGELRRQVDNQNLQTTGFLQQIQALNQQLAAAQSDPQSML